MEPIHVQSNSRNYKVHIGENIRFNIEQYLDKTYSAIMIVTDRNVAQLYLDDLIHSFTHIPVHQAVIPNGEQAKQLKTFYELQTKAIEYELDRKSLIIALGGGVVGDVAGFVAATFMRGIDYVQVPTTILAHDSSVGGKVAINHEFGKNLIGSFHPPAAVIYDVNTLQSLHPRDIRSGYAEVIKEAMIADQVFFKLLLNMDLSSITKEQLSEHLYLGIQIKRDIVVSDEKETGERMYLNLGHTLGHALEAVNHFKMLSHGEAVAVGLLFAIYVSEHHFKIDLCYDQLYEWLNRNEFPLQLQNINRETLFHHMMTDKKAVNNQFNIVLLKRIGKPVIISLSNNQIIKYVHQFLDHFNGLVSKRM